MSDFKSDFEVIRTLGEPALLEQLAEECSELAQAALKLARLERGETTEKKKTRQSEFLKIFPKVGLKEGVIDICPLFLDKSANCIKVNCRVCQKDFWLAEVK